MCHPSVHTNVIKGSRRDTGTILPRPSATHLTEACCTSLTWDGPPLPWSSPVPREAVIVAEQERPPSVDLR